MPAGFVGDPSIVLILIELNPIDLLGTNIRLVAKDLVLDFLQDIFIDNLSETSLFSQCVLLEAMLPRSEIPKRTYMQCCHSKNIFVASS